MTNAYSCTVLRRQRRPDIQVSKPLKASLQVQDSKPGPAEMTVTAVHGTKERPIIQVSLRDFANRKQEIAKDLWKAATEIGFFYLCDTGISEVMFVSGREYEKGI